MGPSEEHRSWRLASLPLRLGGLGLRSAVRLSPAAFWASWADALAMINARHPALARSFVATLGADSISSVGCLSEARLCQALLER